MAYTGNTPSGANAAGSSTNAWPFPGVGNQVLPRAQAPNPVAAAAGTTPAPGTPAHEAGDAIQDTPGKRGRGRPKGSGNKRGTQPVLTYRCRYGCGKQPMKGHVALRRHMMRIHGIFSNEHDGDMQKCDNCTRLYSPKIKDCPCSKGSCRKMTANEELLRQVEYPRDDQEMADTFAYANVGPHRRGPSELVVVLPGHDEAERRDVNALAIRLWASRSPEERARAAPVASLDNAELPTPETTPSKSSQTPVDLTGEEEELPATPVASKKRAAEQPLPGPAPKRTEVAANAAPKRDSFSEAMAFVDSIEPAVAPEADGAALLASDPDYAEMQAVKAKTARPAPIASGSSVVAKPAESTQPALGEKTALDDAAAGASDGIDLDFWDFEAELAQPSLAQPAADDAAANDPEKAYIDDWLRNSTDGVFLQSAETFHQTWNQ